MKDSTEKKINDLLLDICEKFKEKTNIKKNYIEYISSLLYLKYEEELEFEVIYKERKNYYIAKIIDEALNILRANLSNERLFSNIQFQNMTITRHIGEENVLTNIIEELNAIENILKVSIDESKKIVAKSYEFILENCMKKNDIIKGKEEFYTPIYVTELMTELIVNEKKTIYDPWCGSGNFLISAGIKEEKNIMGLEKNISIYNIGMTNLFLHNIENKHLFYEFESPKIENYDFVLSNPPFSIKNWSNEIAKEDKQFINSFGLPETAFGDYAFVLSMLNRLAPNGKMAVILPHGALFRKNEVRVRKKLVEDNYIEAIIGLPENLFFSNRIPVVILIISKNKNEKNILFIDASKQFITEKNMNILSKEAQEEIIKTYKKRVAIKNYSSLVKLDEIKKNDYDLTIKRYVKEEMAKRVKMEKQDILEELYNLEKENSILEDNINDVLSSLGLSEIFIKNKKEIKKSNGEINYKKIGERIKKLRTEKGYSQYEFSEEINLTRMHLNNIEKGTMSISLLSLSKICDKLGISIAEILK